MRKKVIYLLFMVATAITVVGKVEANTCSLEDRNALRAMAANVNVTYEEGSEEYNPEDGVYIDTYFLDVKIYNLTSKMRVEVYTDGVRKPDYFYFDDLNGDGFLSLRSANATKKMKYTIKLYGSSNDCFEQLLRTINITLPKYNYYSGYEICNGVTEFYMCQRFTNYDFDPTTFYSSVYAYKEKINAQQNIIDENGDIEENNSLTSKVLKTISDNKMVIISFILIVGVVATVIVILKKRGSAV